MYVLLIFFMNENSFSLHIYEAIFLRLISLLHFQRQSVSNRKTTQHLIIILSIVLCVVCASLKLVFFAKHSTKMIIVRHAPFIKFPTFSNRKTQRRTYFIHKIYQYAFYVFPKNPFRLLQEYPGNRIPQMPISPFPIFAILLPILQKR